MFLGEYKHNLDEKNRLAVPVKFRQQLAKGSVITKGLDNCLVIYPKQEWLELAPKLANMSITQSKTRAFSRFMLAGAMDVEMDKNGRVILPDYLKKYAGIAKKIVLTGLYNRLEVWDEQKWNKYKNNTEKNSNDIAEALGELGV